ncbi:(2Fe-2S)-binding protein [Cohnella luojiensis]|uniref:Ferric siderophore reductase C-terminal domain-containing protein n=1 Tax=Cohnella luojiensis TaxID=652876 RepID=A0A4Y8LQ87_9BACL|nr:(2Fe-2S)-binding protein [Cohnella luojiensis]TFE23400.1 hypothetical protein E2980_19510 [Cohnella luojiensis]
MDLKLFEEHFHLSDKGSEHPLLSISGNDILNAEPMLAMLRKGSELVKGIGLEIGVSAIGLAFYGLIATKQLVMSQYNRILDLSLDNLTIQIESHNDHAHFVFKISELKWTDLPAEGREAAVLAEWSRYFADTVNPLIEAATSAIGLKPSIVWNQYGARSAYTMDYVRKIVPEGTVRQLIDDDFSLLAGLPGKIFNRGKNPFEFTPCYLDSPYKPGAQIMLRSSCCLWYKRENGVKCYNCPILKDDERTELKSKIEASIKEKEQSA